MDKIWIIFIAVHACLCVIQHPIFRFLDYYLEPDDNIFDIDYSEFWPFWSINVSIFAIYSVIIFIIGILTAVPLT